MKPQLLAVADAAELLGISRAHAYRLVASGDLPSVRLGRRVLIPASVIRAMAA